jgi:hypothetical protein
MVIIIPVQTGFHQEELRPVTTEYTENKVEESGHYRFYSKINLDRS